MIYSTCTCMYLHGILWQVHPANIVNPVIPWEDFLNEELNNRINMALDYRYYNDFDPFTREKSFSFLEYPYILNTANKVEKLLRDNLVSHFSERQRTFVHSLLTGVPDTPFLHLQISREEIVSDTLSQVHIYIHTCTHVYTYAYRSRHTGLSRNSILVTPIQLESTCTYIYIYILIPYVYVEEVLLYFLIHSFKTLFSLTPSCLYCTYMYTKLCCCT